MGLRLKILYLSFYYQPDLSAGSFRNTALVKSLLKKLPKNSQIDVITTLPNRYSSFSAEAPEFESLDKLTISRIALPSHNSGMVDQSKAFVKFACEAVQRSRSKDYDLVFASSSRLMTAMLGAYLARQNKTPLYLDIRDIFVDTIKDVLPKRLAWLTKPIFSVIEKWTIRQAEQVNVVSQGFCDYFQQRYPGINLSTFTNGIDDEFLGVAPQDTELSLRRPVEVLYAGNMGEGQGLHAVIPGLAKGLEDKARFRLIGAGGRQAALEAAIDEAGCANVALESPISRQELIEAYKATDVLFLHLNDYDAFKKVLPSKLFEYAALGKPVWAGVGGYAAEFISENIDNSAVFDPCDIAGGLKSFETLELKTSPRPKFIQKFSRQNIMDAMASEMITISGRH